MKPEMERIQELPIEMSEIVTRVDENGRFYSVKQA